VDSFAEKLPFYLPQAQNERNYITNRRTSTKFHKARNAPQAKPMCANLTPF
jgi:hypothetical protein